MTLTPPPLVILALWILKNTLKMSYHVTVSFANLCTKKTSFALDGFVTRNEFGWVDGNVYLGLVEEWMNYRTKA